jgi:hypothetical protein
VSALDDDGALLSNQHLRHGRPKLLRPVLLPVRRNEAMSYVEAKGNRI